MKNSTKRPSPTEIHLRLVRSIARLHQRDPARFDAGLMADGSVCVRGPSEVAFYSPQGWLSRFTQHLVRGFFDNAAARQDGSKPAGRRSAVLAHPARARAPLFAPALALS